MVIVVFRADSGSEGEKRERLSLGALLDDVASLSRPLRPNEVVVFSDVARKNLNQHRHPRIPVFVQLSAGWFLPPARLRMPHSAGEALRRVCVCNVCV